MAYAVHSNIITTVFWVGEEAGDDNGFIPNYESTWDGSWLRHFGGIDSQDYRDGDNPLLFMPKENPFYFALPYNDLRNNGTRKPDAAAVVPWSGSQQWGPDDSMVKNRWIKITANGKDVYAQWEDAGPFGENDKAYVFGTAPPANGQLAAAGLDISPAAQFYLGMGDVGETSWQFVDFADVPDGPWKAVITTSQVDFNAVPETPTEAANWLIGDVTSESIHGLGGNDTIFASAGTDKVWGDLGNDRLHGGTGNDTIRGGEGNDLIVGESGRDLAYGGAGADRLFGGEGRDRLFGEDGGDTLIGGGGADALDGGAGGDVFAYYAEADSTLALSDVITGFTPGTDRISFRAIDTDAAAVGDQAFHYRGTAGFTGAHAEIRYEIAAAQTNIYADVDGDGTADMRVILDSAVALLAHDFIL
jgi:Ca2+-binding RTX toxin-like protein